MSDGKPRRSLRAPIEKLKEEIAHRHAVQDADKKMPYGRDKPTAAQKRAYLASTEPGGRLHYLIEQAKPLAEKTDRILFVAEMISCGQWRPQMALALAKTWGISVSSVKHYSADAIRLIQTSMGDREDLKTNAMSFLDVVAHDAFDRGDGRTAVTATRTFCEIAGLLAPTKHEVSGPDGAPVQVTVEAIRRMSDAELQAEIVRAAALHAANRAQAEMRELTEAEKAVALLVEDTEITDMSGDVCDTV